MEFNQTIAGDLYKFSLIGKNLFLVAGGPKDYILYKTNEWKCADDINDELLERMGASIDAHQHLVTSSQHMAVGDNNH